MQRYAQLKGEQQRLESCLKETISSWKWEQLRDSEDADIVENNSSNGNDSDGDEMLDFEALPAKKNRSGVQISRCAPVGLPPPRPLLHPTAGSQPRLGFNSLRSRITGSKRRPVLEDSLTPPSSRGSPTMRSSSADRLETSSLRSSSSFIRLASYIAEQTDIADIGLAGINMVRAVRGARRKRAMEREREMQRLAKLIRKYHAQLVFVQGELARIDESGVLANGSRKGVPRSKRSAKHIMMDMVRNASAVLLTVLANLCWLLVVLQIARGALSALFVGEPDLTQRFTYFLPALSMAGGIEGRNKSAKGRLPAQLALPRTQLAMPPLITVCQVVSSGLLFAVVMFGILSFGSSVEESVHPLRFLISSYISRLLRARQWDWLPHILLSSDVLAAINPVTDSSVSPMAKHVEIPSKMVGRTSRIFYSSSSDLTSFYRGVQRESLAYYPRIAGEGVGKACVSAVGTTAYAGD
ncbi:hypothetical protein FBU59_001537 [Linderina macrospora]|uniref:Uncharacterized protein n=1 Tax=Linderina macrospora TaxID=4868 RepID=A0ACC1JDR7_9FUNG|nr:hypothetical protein FBU59_001537 [Linderina macrospora]